MANSRLCSIPDCGKPHRARGMCNAHYKRLSRHGDPTSGDTIRGNPRSFVEDVALTYQGRDCLIWPYAKDRKRYGRIWDGKRMVLTHRYICAMAHGSPPTDTHHAAHSCGNPSCVNPNHLSWKTKKENEADKLVHGTHNRGERHGMSRLDEEEVRKILSLKGTMTQQSIAEKFGIRQQVVSQIHNGKTWAWLE